MVYDTKYDNSLDFSSAFQSYIDSLCNRLIDRYRLQRKRIVEIGCGAGSFLKLLCRKGSATGQGFDPSLPKDSVPVAGVSLQKRYFRPSDAERGFDFLSCRHVLEHIPRPLEFLLGLRRMSAASPAANYYFEVPNGSFVLGGEGVWDVIYPHVSYFTEASLRALFERAGFEVLHAGKSFSDQFLFIEARAVPPGQKNSHPSESRIALSEEITSFATHFARSIEAWSTCLARLSADEKQLAFWGAGAKGVTFLNLVPGARNIANVIDLNIRKQQMFVPGTGQRVMSPRILREVPPGAVILLNAAYRREVGSLLSEQGIKARIITEPRSALQ